MASCHARLPLPALALNGRRQAPRLSPGATTLSARWLGAGGKVPPPLQPPYLQFPVPAAEGTPPSPGAPGCSVQAVCPRVQRPGSASTGGRKLSVAQAAGPGGAGTWGRKLPCTKLPGAGQMTDCPSRPRQSCVSPAVPAASGCVT